jgi:hypothetical protein
MKKILFIMLFALPLFAQGNFATYFYDKTLRLDYQHAGDISNQQIFLDELIEEPTWGGPRQNLIEPFEYGKYRFTVTDSASGTVIFAKNYSTLFSEWQTTEEAKHAQRSFPESVVFPYPKNKVIVTFYARDKRNELHKTQQFTVDPGSYFVKKERRLVFPNFKVHYSGDPATKVDIVILPEGYTADEMALFHKDCEKFANYLFNSSPYKENKDKFNIWGVEAPSPESGTDIPSKNIWKRTLLNTSFCTFDLDRYCMTTDYKSVRDLAANAPYDQIYLLVNTSKYGGGAIYNFYSICVNNNRNEEYIFTHEFGHGFASLADEYYESSTAYEDFYAKDVEPADPNITTLVDFSKKWKDLVDKDTPIPTPADGAYKDKVGAFEGGGYVNKGIYRPRFDCTMKSISINNFCPVCKRAIEKMIDYYAH